MADYFHDLTALARQMPDAINPQDWLELQVREPSPVVRSIIDARMALGVDSERHRFAELITSYLVEESEDFRAAALCVASEALTLKRIDAASLQMAIYHDRQPLFEELPQLLPLARKGELIPAEAIDEVLLDGSVRIGNYYAALDSHLQADLVVWLLSEFPKAPLWLRLNPLVRPTTGHVRNRINEEILRPADRNWWRTLALHLRGKTAAVYALSPLVSVTDSFEQYWEFHVKGLRRIETIAQRNKVGYLSMMLEELEDTGDFLLGRMIHFDTLSRQSTAGNDAIITHLDLAANVYVFPASRSRLEHGLDKGKTVDATARAHLLRVEDISGAVVLPLLSLFFRAKSLITELAADQFE